MKDWEEKLYELLAEFKCLDCSKSFKPCESCNFDETTDEIYKVIEETLASEKKALSRRLPKKQTRGVPREMRGEHFKYGVTDASIFIDSIFCDGFNAAIDLVLKEMEGE